MSAYLRSEYRRYVEQCEEAGERENNIMDYDDWKDSQGYRGEYDPDN